MGGAGQRRGGSGAAARAGLLAIALGALPAAGTAQSAGPRLRLDSASSRVWFDGSSTFGAFTATTASLSGWTQLAAPGQFAEARGQVDMRAATLHTGIGLRDRHLRQALDTDRFPLVTLVLERVTLAAGGYAGASEGTAVALQGALRVKDRPYPVTFAATAAFHGDTLLVVGRAPLRFTEVGMKPPTRLLGSVKVHDEFVLRFDGRFLPDRS